MSAVCSRAEDGSSSSTLICSFRVPLFASFGSSPVDVSSVLSDFGQVRLRADLSSTWSTDVPSVQDWTLTYYYRQYSPTEPGVSSFGAEE